MADCHLLRLQSGVYGLEGSLTFETVPALREAGIDALRASDGGLTLELSRLPHVDSAGLALLIDWLAVARQAARALRFTHAPEALLALARLSAVESLIVGDAATSR